MGFHWGSAPHFLPPAPQRPVAVANRRCPLAKAWPGPQALPRDSDGRVGADELAEGLARLPRARCASGAGEVATAAGAGLDGRVGLPALERAVRAGLTRRCEATIREARVRAEPARLAAAIPLTTAGAGYSTQHAAAAPAERGTAAVNASAASAERVQPTTGWLGAWDPHRI